MRIAGNDSGLMQWGTLNFQNVCHIEIVSSDVGWVWDQVPHTMVRLCVPIFPLLLALRRSFPNSVSAIVIVSVIVIASPRDLQNLSGRCTSKVSTGSSRGASEEALPASTLMASSVR